MKEFVCLEIFSRPDEEEKPFSQRLSVFWTGLLRSESSFFEKVFAESVNFIAKGELLVRIYAIEPGIAEDLYSKLLSAGFSLGKLDFEDLYSQFEIVPPEWMQIEH